MKEVTELPIAQIEPAAKMIQLPDLVKQGYGVYNPSTSFEGLSPEQVYQRCKLFGGGCYAFDSLGSLYLKRDVGKSEIKPLIDQFKASHRLYIVNRDAVCGTFPNACQILRQSPLDAHKTEGRASALGSTIGEAAGIEKRDLPNPEFATQTE